MGANTLWMVKVRKSYTETIEISAVTSDEAHEKARREHGVIMVESVEWKDPEVYDPIYRK